MCGLFLVVYFFRSAPKRIECVRASTGQRPVLKERERDERNEPTNIEYFLNGRIEGLDASGGGEPKLQDGLTMPSKQQQVVVFRWWRSRRAHENSNYEKVENTRKGFRRMLFECFKENCYLGCASGGGKGEGMRKKGGRGGIQICGPIFSNGVQRFRPFNTPSRPITLHVPTKHQISTDINLVGKKKELRDAHTGIPLRCT